jgi:hypothetical protein
MYVKRIDTLSNLEVQINQCINKHKYWQQIWERKKKVQKRKFKIINILIGEKEDMKERKTFIILCRGLCLFLSGLPWEGQWTCGYYSMTPL